MLYFFFPPINSVTSTDASGQQQPSSVGAQPHSGASDPGPIRATAPMWRCSRIMHMQRELHPTLLSSLEGIVDQMVWFRENWHEEVRGSGSEFEALRELAVDQMVRKRHSRWWEFFPYKSRSERTACGFVRLTSNKEFVVCFGASQ